MRKQVCTLKLLPKAPFYHKTPHVNTMQSALTTTIIVATWLWLLGKLPNHNNIMCSILELQYGLVAAGIDHAKYNGHSFCIGAVTTAASRSLKDSRLLVAGRVVLLCYVKKYLENNIIAVIHM